TKTYGRSCAAYATRDSSATRRSTGSSACGESRRRSPPSAPRQPRTVLLEIHEPLVLIAHPLGGVVEFAEHPLEHADAVGRLLGDGVGEVESGFLRVLGSSYAV